MTKPRSRQNTAPTKATNHTGTLAANRRAIFDYDFIEKIEAGIVLSGPEVKSVKAGQANLSGSYVVFSTGKPSLIGARISQYPYSAQPQDPERTRQLLLSKSQIASLLGKVQEAGNSLIPLRIYATRGFIKVELGLGKGKRRYDKRETIKKRDTDRDVQRELRGRER